MLVKMHQKVADFSANAVEAWNKKEYAKSIGYGVAARVTSIALFVLHVLAEVFSPFRIAVQAGIIAHEIKKNKSALSCGDTLGDWAYSDQQIQLNGAWISFLSIFAAEDFYKQTLANRICNLQIHCDVNSSRVNDAVCLKFKKECDEVGLTYSREIFEGVVRNMWISTSLNHSIKGEINLINNLDASINLAKKDYTEYYIRRMSESAIKQIHSKIKKSLVKLMSNQPQSEQDKELVQSLLRIEGYVQTELDFLEAQRLRAHGRRQVPAPNINDQVGKSMPKSEKDFRQGMLESMKVICKELNTKQIFQKDGKPAYDDLSDWTAMRAIWRLSALHFYSPENHSKCKHPIWKTPIKDELDEALAKQVEIVTEDIDIRAQPLYERLEKIEAQNSKDLQVAKKAKASEKNKLLKDIETRNKDFKNEVRAFRKQNEVCGKALEEILVLNEKLNDVNTVIELQEKAVDTISKFKKLNNADAVNLLESRLAFGENEYNKALSEKLKKENSSAYKITKEAESLIEELIEGSNGYGQKLFSNSGYAAGKGFDWSAGYQEAQA